MEEKAADRMRRVEAETADLEEVLHQRDQLQSENQRLKKFAALIEQKHQRQTHQMSLELEDKKEDLQKTSGDLTRIKGDLDQELSTNRFLREDLTEAKAKCGSMQRQIEALKRTIDEMTPSAELEKIFARLSSEICNCLQDLSTLSSTLSQFACGQDPNISNLLGINSNVLENLDSDELSPIDKAQRQLDKVKMVRKDILGLRDNLAEKYADNLGNNFTNTCITS